MKQFFDFRAMSILLFNTKQSSALQLVPASLVLAPRSDAIRSCLILAWTFCVRTKRCTLRQNSHNRLARDRLAYIWKTAIASKIHMLKRCWWDAFKCIKLNWKTIDHNPHGPHTILDACEYYKYLWIILSRWNTSSNKKNNKMKEKNNRKRTKELECEWKREKPWIFNWSFFTFKMETSSKYKIYDFRYIPV